MDQSGDLALILETDTHCYLGLIDGLGHGSQANEAASLALDYLKFNFTNDLSGMIVEMNELLKQSRGAVMALCILDKRNGALLHAGIGNITVRVLGANPFKITPRDGVVGFNIPTPHMQKFSMMHGDILLMYSDGIQENIDLLDCPEVRYESAQEITATIMSKYGKRDDDMSLIALRIFR